MKAPEGNTGQHLQQHQTSTTLLSLEMEIATSLIIHQSHVLLMTTPTICEPQT